MQTPHNVVVCEDDAFTQVLLRKALAPISKQIQLHFFDAVGPALLAAERLQPRLIVMDHHLRGASGVDALRRLRASQWGRDIPVLVFSGADVGAQALAEGASDVLKKPATADQILGKVRSLTGM